MSTVLAFILIIFGIALLLVGGWYAITGAIDGQWRELIFGVVAALGGVALIAARWYV